MARKRKQAGASQPATRKRAPQPTTLTAAPAGNRHVVYVHGICRHDAGYSDSWWAAMRPYVNGIADANRHEVLWSDIITPADRRELPLHAVEGLSLRLAQARPPDDPREAVLAAEILDVLADRVQRQHLDVAIRPQGLDRPLGLEAAPAHTFLLAETLAPLPFLGLPNFECINDFLQYLLDDSIRDQVLGRFDQVVKPLLQNSYRLEVISHSWGTVVAYEALRRMDSNLAGIADGAVHTMFTVGSALSIPAVKRRLLPAAADGQRPRVVASWVNLNAHFDVVGGPLSGNPFQVDAEYLNLPPVGCSAIIPNPPCAHGSYFRPDNVTVNRDIFGKHIAN
jgi:hypothetical protein